MANFKKVRSITKTLLKMQNNTPYYLRITAPMYTGKKIGDKDPATLADCVNLETGEECQIIVGAVLKKELEACYEGNSYVGRCFEIVKFRDAAHDYNTYNVSEVAAPDDEAQDDTESDAGKSAKATKGGKK